MAGAGSIITRRPAKHLGKRTPGGHHPDGVATPGIAVCAGPITSAGLLRAADAATYEAEDAGGTRCVVRRVQPARVG
jgi:GGDEF domain-containing protein